MPPPRQHRLTSTGIECPLGCRTCSAEEIEAAATLLRRADALAYTTVVAAPRGASLGARYAAISSAVALGERVRDRGGHALVVIDDLACMVRALASHASMTSACEHAGM